MEHWTYQRHLRKLAKKVLGFQRGLKDQTTVSILNASISADQECAKKMLELDPEEIRRLIETLDSSGYPQLSKKLTVWLCYVEQVQELLEMNLRELIGLTRDDIATLQRTVSLAPIIKGGRKIKMLELLTDLTLDYAEAESIDNDIQILTGSEKQARA